MSEASNQDLLATILTDGIDHDSCMSKAALKIHPRYESMAFSGYGLDETIACGRISEARDYA
jgi:hypothetical protein